VDEIPYQGSPSNPANTVPLIRTLGVAATSSSQTPISLSAVATMQQAFTSTGHQIMFRFQFGALPASNALANFFCTGFVISWVYLTA
jgi:hypothetical protein